MLEKFNMTNCNPTSTPADPSVKLVKPSDINSSLDVPYRQAVGSLMYLMLATRPDIAAAVIKVSQYASCYDSSHWTAIKRILRYVKGTDHYVLTIGGLSGGTNSNSSSNPIILHGSCDADWGGDLDDRRSTSGYLFAINTGGAISWQTRKQTSVATSSTQAEYHALSTATKETIWLRTLLSELRFPQPSATVIQQDNQSTIALAHNPINHGRTKHIDIAHHYLRECIENKEITLEYCPTTSMVADIMTKPLSRTKFETCRHHMGIRTLC
jgi:hypothetical protein